jgi:hypothetical protein
VNLWRFTSLGFRFEVLRIFFEVLLQLTVYFCLLSFVELLAMKNEGVWGITWVCFGDSNKKDPRSSWCFWWASKPKINRCFDLFLLRTVILLQFFFFLLLSNPLWSYQMIWCWNCRGRGSMMKIRPRISENYEAIASILTWFWFWKTRVLHCVLCVLEFWDFDRNRIERENDELFLWFSDELALNGWFLFCIEWCGLFIGLPNVFEDL